jgi:hypothetical protein
MVTDLQRLWDSTPVIVATEVPLEGFESVRSFVKNTLEFQRVLKLPRVRWEDRQDLEELQMLLTEEYRLPWGKQFFWPHQAVCLETLSDYRGLFGVVGTGMGKTFISWIAPVVLGAERYALFLPSGHIEMAQRDHAIFREHWKAPIHLEFFAYEEMSRNKGEERLARYNPDLIGADECHRIKNLTAACTKRICRYLRQNTNIPFFALSGSTITRSLADFHHLLALTIGPMNMPLPITQKEMRVWGRCVDVKVPSRSMPGALRFFLPPGKLPTLQNVRDAVGLRIQETPGIVRTQTPSVDIPLYLEFFHPELDDTQKTMLEVLIDRHEAPNGDLATPVDIYKHARTIVCGYFRHWDPKPPAAWLQARRAWKRVVRDTLALGDPRYDSESPVLFAFQRGDVDVPWGPLERNAFAQWVKVRKTFNGKSIPVWISDSFLHQVIDYKRTSIYWTEFVPLGERLSAITGWEYFGEKGHSARGNFIDDANGTIIASIGANTEGRNLQYKWSHNTILTPVGNGKIMEQLISRTHRVFQKEDETVVRMILGHEKIKDIFEQAMEDARGAYALTQQEQKLLIAKWINQP